jgi:hypothetical protein
MCLGVIAAAFILTVDDGTVHFVGVRLPMTCTLYEWFHIKCATCGMTRAFVYAAHGNLSAAADMNPMWPVAAAAFLIEIAYRVAALASWPSPLPKRLRIAHALLLIAAALAILCHWAIYLLSLLR